MLPMLLIIPLAMVDLALVLVFQILAVTWLLPVLQLLLQVRLLPLIQLLPYYVCLCCSRYCCPSGSSSSRCHPVPVPPYVLDAHPVLVAPNIPVALMLWLLPLFITKFQLLPLFLPMFLHRFWFPPIPHQVLVAPHVPPQVLVAPPVPPNVPDTAPVPPNIPVLPPVPPNVPVPPHSCAVVVKVE